MGKLLFEVREEQLETGMRGYPVGYCVTSSVDPLKGIFYRGIPVAELGNKEPEEVIYLLYYGKLGSKEDVEKFSKQLADRSHCSKKLLDHIKLLPKEGSPMNLFSAALALAATYEGTNNYREDCINLIAKAPEIVATIINHHGHFGEGAASNPSIGYMENFTSMLNVPVRDKQELTEVFKLFNILHYDHGGGNLSTFVGKAVASGLEDMYGSINAAMLALAGPRHGRANQDCLHFLEELLSEMGEDANAPQVEKMIRKRLSENKLLFGFGHAVLRVEDPRATLLYALADEKYGDHPLIKMAHLLKVEGSKVLIENPKISDPYPNVDAISGAILTAAGFPYPEYYTLLFGLARIVGISIQIVYERCEAREGKGTPLVRPSYTYKESIYRENV